VESANDTLRVLRANHLDSANMAAALGRTPGSPPPGETSGPRGGL